MQYSEGMVRIAADVTAALLQQLRDAGCPAEHFDQVEALGKEATRLEDAGEHVAAHAKAVEWSMAIAVATAAVAASP